MDVGIVGCGPCGCLAALLLALNPCFKRVDMFDVLSEGEILHPQSSNQAERRSTLSLTINGRGQNALKAANILDDVVHCGVWLDHLAWHAEDRTYRQAYGKGRLVSIRRRVLMDILLSECKKRDKINLHFSQTNSRLWTAPNKYHLLVGCDGIHSKVRDILFGTERLPIRAYDMEGNDTPQHVQERNSDLAYVEFEGLSSASSTSLTLSHGLHLWSPHGRKRSEIGFVLGVPNTTGTLDIGVYASQNVLSNPEAVKQCLIEDYRFPSDSSKFTFSQIETLRTVISPQMCNDRGDVILLGDAACTKVPFLGVGGNSALEDALLFSEYVKHCTSHSHIRYKVLAFSRQRILELRLLANLSLDEGENMMYRSPPREDEEVEDNPSANLFENISFGEMRITDAVELWRAGTGGHSNKLVKTSKATSRGLKYHTPVGSTVEQGDIIGIIDSVKSRRILRASASGTVASIDFATATIVVNPHQPQAGVGEESTQEEIFKMDGGLLQEWLSKLSVKELGRFVSYRRVTGSTMDDAARDLAASGGTHGSLYIAEQQTKGRGRGGRKWSSKMTGNIYMTLSVHGLRNPLTIPLAICIALREVGLVNAMIKWPNDIYSKKRKVCGMLIEQQTEEVSLVGIGLNVYETFDRDSLATSVAMELGSSKLKCPTREELIARICHQLQVLNKLSLEQLVNGIFPSFDALMGHVICVSSKQELERISVTDDSGKSKTLAVPFYAVARAVSKEGALYVSPIGEIDSNIYLIDSECSVSKHERRQVLVYNGPGADERCVEMTLSMLRGELDEEVFFIRTVSPKQVRDPAWKWESECSLLVFPGGADIPMTKALGDAGQHRIKSYVCSYGGKYLGFCAGAYFACSRIEFDKRGPLEVCQNRILSLFPGVAIGPIFPGFVYNGLEGSWCVKLVSDDAEYYSYFNGGCYFRPNEDHDDIGNSDGNWDIVALYDKLLLPAVVKCSFKSGGVAVLCGSHPEFDPFRGEWQEDGSTEVKGENLKSPPHVAYGEGLYETLCAKDKSRRSLIGVIIGYVSSKV